MSIQERREQAVIEDSVKLDLAQNRVSVHLPFMKDPVKHLVDKHQGNSNYVQALRVYYTQCRKDARILEGNPEGSEGTLGARVHGSHEYPQP